MPLPSAPKKRAHSVKSSQTKQNKRTAPDKSQNSLPPTIKGVAHSEEASVLAMPNIKLVPQSNRSLTTKTTKEKLRPVAKNISSADIVPKTKLFVLDTNVLLHDPISIFQFAEHDVYLPMIVLEELDGHKKGLTDLARSARQISRSLDMLVKAEVPSESGGIALSGAGHKNALGNLFFQTEVLDTELPIGLPKGKADNQILGVFKALRERYPSREVVLVSKDINIRIKARALGFAADDYTNDKALEDSEILYTGTLALPANFWDTQGENVQSWVEAGHSFYRISGSLVDGAYINQFVYIDFPGEPPLEARVIAIEGKTAVLKTIRDYTHVKNNILGVTARNREQNYALNLLLDPEVDFVTLCGTAGSGKTLLALAAGLRQVTEDRRYTEIIMTRATVSVGEDIGFLPGSEEEKMGPWMGALDDNLEYLTTLGKSGAAGLNQKPGTDLIDWNRSKNIDALKANIKVKSMNFMRGRTFLNKYLILDEAQNLTPKQMKTLITRAGPGTKIVCMGNLAQIDTPYLTEGSSGLTFAVDRFKNWAHGGHITFARGERSRLADFASEVL